MSLSVGSYLAITGRVPNGYRAFALFMDALPSITMYDDLSSVTVSGGSSHVTPSGITENVGIVDGNVYATLVPVNESVTVS